MCIKFKTQLNPMKDYFNHWICDVSRDLVPFVQFKKRRNFLRGVLLLVKLQALARNYTKSNTPLWVFFTFLKFYKRYQIAQRITYYFYQSFGLQGR